MKTLVALLLLTTSAFADNAYTYSITALRVQNKQVIAEDWRVDAVDPDTSMTCSYTGTTQLDTPQDPALTKDQAVSVTRKRSNVPPEAQAYCDAFISAQETPAITVVTPEWVDAQ